LPERAHHEVEEVCHANHTSNRRSACIAAGDGLPFRHGFHPSVDVARHGAGIHDGGDDSTADDSALDDSALDNGNVDNGHSASH
jgi:hypothetical protein